MDETGAGRARPRAQLAPWLGMGTILLGCARQTAGSAGDAGAGRPIDGAEERSGNDADLGRGSGTSGAADSGARATRLRDASSDSIVPLLDPDCPRIEPTPTVTEQVFVIGAVDLTRDRVTFVNVTQTPQPLPAFWQWCSVLDDTQPTYGAVVSTDVEVPVGGSLTLDLRSVDTAAAANTGSPIDLHLEGGEFALYRSTGGFQQDQLMEVYLAWGNHGIGRSPVAFQAGLWAFGARITVEPGAGGFVLTGTADDPNSYVSVPLRCLP